MALNLPPIVGGAPKQEGNNLTRILELKSRADTLQLTREQLEQRKKELGFEETGRTLTAARAVIENTQPGSPAWKNATQHIVRAYGGDPSAINVPDADVAKSLTAAIKKINAASMAYTAGKKTRQQLQDESSEIAVATLMGIGAFPAPITKESGMGQAVGLLVNAAEGGQKTFQAGAQEDIATAGHAARTGTATAAARELEDQRFQHAKEKYDYGIGRGGTGKAGKTVEDKRKDFEEDTFSKLLGAIPKTEEKVVGKGFGGEGDIVGKVARPVTAADITGISTRAKEAALALYPEDEPRAEKVGREAGSLAGAGVPPQLAGVGALAEEVGPPEAFPLPKAILGEDGVDNVTDLVDGAIRRMRVLDELAAHNFPSAIKESQDLPGFAYKLLKEAGVPDDEIKALMRIIGERGTAEDANPKQ